MINDNKKVIAKSQLPKRVMYNCKSMSKFLITFVVCLSAVAVVKSNIFYESDPWLKIDDRLVSEQESWEYEKNYPIAEKYLEEEKQHRRKHNKELIEALELFLKAKQLTELNPECNSRQRTILDKLDEFLNHGFYKKECARLREIFEYITTNYADKCHNVNLKWKKTRAELDAKHRSKFLEGKDN